MNATLIIASYNVVCFFYENNIKRICYKIVMMHA